MSTPEENIAAMQAMLDDAQMTANVARMGEKHALEKTWDLEAQIKRLKETIDNADGFASEAELFEIGALLGVCDDMGRNPLGERPGPKRGEILTAVRALHRREDDARDLLRDCQRALNRLDAYEGLCERIAATLNPDDED